MIFEVSIYNRNRPRKQRQSGVFQSLDGSDYAQVSSRNHSGKQRKMNIQEENEQRKRIDRTHPSTLTRRNSLLNTFYDTYLGPSDFNMT